MHTRPSLPTDGLPLVDTDGGAGQQLGVLGVRGGVGTSTIAAALGADDHGVDTSGPTYGSAVVLVTSPAVTDTERLLPLVDRCCVRGLDPLVVAVVSDGHGRWPTASRARLRMIRDLADVVPVPWVGRWRWTGADDRATAEWFRAMARLAKAGRTRPREDGLATRGAPRRWRPWRRRRKQ